MPADQWVPRCFRNESARLRVDANPDGFDPDRVAGYVERQPDGVVWKDPVVVRYVRKIMWESWTVVRVYRDPTLVARSERRWETGQSGDLAARANRWNRTLTRYISVPAVTLQAVEMFDDPVWALEILAYTLGVDVQPWQRGRTLDYIRPGQPREYRCPLPSRCGLH